MNPTDLGLLIDDDELYVRTLQRSLSRRGLETRTATGIAEALRVAEEIRPAFALVDLRLGEDSGLTLIRPLRAARRHADPAGHRLRQRGHGGRGDQARRRRLPAKPATAPMILRTLGLVKPESVEIEATMTPLHRLEWEHIHQALHETGATSRPPPACWACTGAPCSASWPRNRGRNAKCCWIDLCRCDISSHPPTAATAAPLPGKTLNPAIWGWRHAGQCDHSSQA